MIRAKAKDRTSNIKIPIKEQHSAPSQCKFIYTKLIHMADVTQLKYAVLKWLQRKGHFCIIHHREIFLVGAWRNGVQI